MIAWAAIEKLRLGFSDTIEGQEVYARWPFARAEEEEERGTTGLEEMAEGKEGRAEKGDGKEMAGAER